MDENDALRNSNWAYKPSLCSSNIRGPTGEYTPYPKLSTLFQHLQFHSNQSTYMYENHALCEF